MKSVRTLRLLLAHHEAGHAVVARALGVEATMIAVFGTDEKSMAGAQTVSAAHANGETCDSYEADAKVIIDRLQRETIAPGDRPRGGAAGDAGYSLSGRT
jgi:hypothetical protein